MNEQHHMQGGDTSVMSVKDWLVTLILLIIPCVNIVMLIVWAASSSGNLNRKNYCIAYLIVLAAIVVLYILLFLVFGAAMFAIFDAF